ncbi:endonuclease/exonuclease/phosphatase family protein [Wenyingzhuangia sp. chi5]|uniref:Endonuclease/exonuclease/phosphatase family protein n=1 Tax=Wenyingzhuangia gilva TaxID=3057677 RepID=A0ABT8VSE2_9FLAO|nr:endonuclease/exonuclease/phosphatase family protein [Wenyingzhuangia sp. chi5]MDO3694896.1 endonuclease/exonuclease/phosphatase family protein [Wenyingzhuangia sp. chi5]
MEAVYYTLNILVVVLTFLPKVPHQHWIYRIASFGKIHLTVFQILILLFGFLTLESNYCLIIAQLILSVTIAHNVKVLYPYIALKNKKVIADGDDFISIISVNVYQFNKEYHHLIDLIAKHQPDILLTLESNQDWENALETIEDKYPNHQKVALENTYGMHFYTKLDVEDMKVNYFVSDDIPSIAAKLKTNNGIPFMFYGIHPPPASPTEESNSKEKDGELLCMAKTVKKQTLPTVVIGDFNSVAWSRITKMFTKISGLNDARKGRGFISTFPAKYRFFKIPLDLIYHSNNIKIRTIKTLEPINSDHLPLYVDFCMDLKQHSAHNTSSNLMQEADELINEGRKEESDNR